MLIGVVGAMVVEGMQLVVAKEGARAVEAKAEVETLLSQNVLKKDSERPMPRSRGSRMPKPVQLTRIKRTTRK